MRTLGMSLFLGLVLVFTTCEDYQDEEVLISDFDGEACELLADTVFIATTAGDLALLGPAWTDDLIEDALVAENRLDDSWLNSAREIVPGVYAFKHGSDTLAMLEIADFVDVDGMSVDSITVNVKYNAAGTPDFSAATDTSYLIEHPATTPVYLKFTSGLVTASDAWDLSFDDATIVQADDLQMAYVAGAVLADQTTAPTGPYHGEGLGIDVAYEQLEADTSVLDQIVSQARLTLQSEDNAGYVLLDWQGQTAGEVTFFMNNYLQVRIWDETGAELEIIGSEIALSTIAYCPDLLSRYTFELGNEVYLVQFNPGEQMTSLGFRLVLMEGE